MRVHVFLHVSVCCLLPGVFPSPPDYQHWQICFFSLSLSLVGVSAGLCVFALDDPQKFSLSSFTLHCLPGCCYWQPEPKGNSWACKEQCTPSLMFSILKLRLERLGFVAPGYMCLPAFIIHSIRCSHCDWYCFCKKRPKNAAETFPRGKTERMYTNYVKETIQTKTALANLSFRPMIYHAWCLEEDWDYIRKCLACWSIYSTHVADVSVPKSDPTHTVNRSYSKACVIK